VVIDLGRDRSSVDDDPAGWPRSVRRLLVALVAVLTVVLTGGAEPVRSAFVALAEVPVTEADVIALSRDVVFVADREDTVVAGTTMHGVVAAYALPGGARRWRTRIPQVGQELRFAPGARVVLAVTHEGRGGAMRTVALDAGTGELLWSSPSAGFVHAPAGSARGLLFDNTAAGRAVGWADLRTGRTIWSRAVPAGGDVQLIYGAVSDPVGVLLVGPDGALDLLAEQTGAVLAAGRLAILRRPGEQGRESDGTDRAQVNIIKGHVLVLRRQDPRNVTLSAFDLATFRAQWAITGDFYGFVCGPMACLSTRDGLTVLDLASGAVVWHTNQWRAGPMIDRDRLLVVTEQHGMGVLEARTGRVLMQMSSGWTPVYDTVSTGVRLVVRPDSRQYGRFWFATLDPTHGTPTLLGYLPGLVFQDCQTANDLLACDTPRHTVQIWRYRT
jgi:outer membrane protein assembly factor BamB